MTLAHTDSGALSEELTQVVRTATGVTAVYTAKPILETTITVLGQRLTHRAASSELVSVTITDAGIDVHAVIGVGDSEPAPVVCRRVHDLLRDYLAARNNTEPAVINVKVGRVG